MRAQHDCINLQIPFTGNRFGVVLPLLIICDIITNSTIRNHHSLTNKSIKTHM